VLFSCYQTSCFLLLLSVNDANVHIAVLLLNRVQKKGGIFFDYNSQILLSVLISFAPVETEYEK